MMFLSGKIRGRHLRKRPALTAFRTIRQPYQSLGRLKVKEGVEEHFEI